MCLCVPRSCACARVRACVCVCANRLCIRLRPLPSSAALILPTTEVAEIPSYRFSSSLAEESVEGPAWYSWGHSVSLPSLPCRFRVCFALIRTMRITEVNATLLSSPFRCRCLCSSDDIHRGNSLFYIASYKKSVDFLL